MRVERVMARLSGGSLWREPNAPRGGWPEISNEELMGALGGLPAGPTRLAYLMWGLSAADLSAAERVAMVEASGLREIQRSGIGERPGLLRAFCRVALAEVALPPICRSCKGAGFRGAKACHRCEGSGNASLSLRAKAEIASVHYPCNKDTWGELAKRYGYEAVYQMVECWRGRAIGHVYAQLREPIAAVG